MDFLKELHEARMTKDERDQKNLSYSDCCEKLYLSLFIIEIMRQYPASTSFIRTYCKTTLHNDYKHFKISGTDLYNLIYFINGDDHALSKLKNYESAKRMQSISAYPIRAVNDYLEEIAGGHAPSFPQKLFIQLENGLHINNNNYRHVRRKITRLSELSLQDKTSIVTTVLFAARTKLRNSDLIEQFSKLAANKNLENDKVKDTQPIFSKPDLVTTGKDIAYYRLLTSPKNLILIKRFLELSQEGKSIPANMVQAYAPIAAMMHDIVVAGPTFIQMFKSIQKRAKKTHSQ